MCYVIQAADEDSDLQLLLAMTDLLASCSEGENPFIDSVCQTVYTVEELLQILSNPVLPPDRKRPFARFLVCVYMNTDRYKQKIKSSEFTDNKLAKGLKRSQIYKHTIKTFFYLHVFREIWGYLEHLTTLLKGMKEVLRALSSTDSYILREELSPRFHSRTCHVFWREGSLSRPRIPSTSSTVTPFVTGEDGDLLPGTCKL